MGTNSSNSVVGSFAWSAFERIASQGLGLLVQIILARVLLPEDFACIAIINTLILYFGLFVQAGLNIVVIQKNDLQEEDVSTLLVASLMVAFVLYLLLFFLAPFISEFYDVGDIVWPIRVMALVLFLYSYNSIQTGLLARRMMFKTVFFRSVVSLPIAALFGITMAYASFGVWALIAYSFLNSFLTVLFMNLIPDIRIKWGFSWKRAKEMYSFSSKILISALISNGGDTIRTMAIGKFYSPNNLAYYDRAYNYANFATRFFKQTINSVMLPVLSRKQNDNSRLLETARKTVSFSAFLIIPALVLLAVISKPLIVVVLTEKWIPCSFFFSIFCLFRIPDIITTIDKQVFYAIGRSDIGLYYEIILLILNIIVLIITLQFGLIYVAVGALVVEYSANFTLMLISSKVYSYSFRKRLGDIFKPVCNSIIMGIGVYIIGTLISNCLLSVIIQCITALLIYSFLVFLSKDRNAKLLIEMVNKKLSLNKK